jgi:FlaG/FlaF family flagellin (archaellin)
MRESSRGQPETVGVVLLTAVVVVLVAVVGTVLLSDFQRNGETEPTVAVESAVNGTELVIEHQGGTTYDAADVFVVLRGSYEGRYGLSDGAFNLTAGADPSTFSPGDRWELTEASLSGVTGEITLRVFDEDSNELLHGATYELD